MVATGSWAGSITFFQADGLKVTKELGAPGPSVCSLAFNKPGKIVAVGRIDGTVELWAWQEGARLAAFPAQCGCVSAVLFLHAGDRFLTALNFSCILGSVMVRISWPAQGLPGLSSSFSCTLGGSQPRR